MNSSPNNDGMSTIVRTVCGWVKPFILIYGIHVILYGHITPGGGFAGGVIAAAAFVLVILAEGEQAAARNLSHATASTWDSLGVLLFWAMATLGIAVAGLFFVNFWTTPQAARLTLFSGGIIPVFNVGIGLKVCCSLYVVVLLLTSMNLHSSDGDTS